MEGYMIAFVMGLLIGVVVYHVTVGSGMDSTFLRIPVSKPLRRRWTDDNIATVIAELKLR